MQVYQRSVFEGKLKNLKHMFDCDKINKSKNRRYIYDLVLLAVFVCIGVLLLIFMGLFRSKAGTVSIVCHTTEGDETRVVSLDRDFYMYIGFEMSQMEVDKVFFGEPCENPNEIDRSYEEYNLIYVHDSALEVIEASCPDLVCVHTSAIKQSGDTIVCLPHRLIISMEGQGEATDAVTW